jgi:hypothetical protein
MKNISTRLFLLSLVIAGVVLGCTIAVVSESVAGYPMLWKNRDVHNYDQEMRYFDSGYYRFVTNVYKGETHRAWAGLNDAGFAIVNTDTYNQGVWAMYGPDDGHVMFWALSNCLTVDDFEAYLDSTNVIGRRSTHCYGVIDAFGGAAVFEAGRYNYVRFDAEDSPNGVLIRTNYADSGSDTTVGENRRIRAEQIVSMSSIIDPYLFLFILARDLYLNGFDPYPLPFSGTYSFLPAGVISTDGTINRYYTTSASVIRGVGKSGAPGMMWEYLGEPILSIPLPLWVQAGEVPYELGSPSGSTICRMAREFKSMCYTTPTTLNTYPLADLQSFYYPIETDIYFDIYDLYTSGPSAFFDTAGLSDIQTEIAARVASAYSELHELLVREWGHCLPSNVDIECHPNPFNSTAEMSIYVPTPAYAEVRLFDITGRLAKTPLPKGLLEPGKTTFRISSEDLTSGVYLAALIIDGEIKRSKRLVVVE